MGDSELVENVSKIYFYTQENPGGMSGPHIDISQCEKFSLIFSKRKNTYSTKILVFFVFLVLLALNES